MKISKADIIQFIKFSIVGASNTAISLGIYYIFVFINPRLYMAGNIVGWVVSVANAFFWNNRFVFKSKSEGFKALVRKILKTYLSYGTTFLLSSLLLYIQVDVLGWSDKLAPLINLLITIPLNFLFNKFWTFRGKK